MPPLFSVCPLLFLSLLVGARVLLNCLRILLCICTKVLVFKHVEVSSLDRGLSLGFGLCPLIVLHSAGGSSLTMAGSSLFVGVIIAFQGSGRATEYDKGNWAIF